jgi:hydroxypyruvate isomerase
MDAVICLEMIYPDLEVSQKIEKIASLGFRYAEFWDWCTKDIKGLASVCRNNDVKIVNFSGYRSGNLVDANTHDILLSDLREAVKASQELNCPILMLLTNELGDEGKVKNSYKDIPWDEKFSNVVTGLKKALSITPQDITLVLEPLNTKIDHPGYFLDDMETAVSIIKKVNDNRLQILCDLYHLGVMGSDLRQLITKYREYIGYIHIADFPGRHEPGTGSADWPALLRILQDEVGYKGYVGFEYSPIEETERSLKSIYALWNSF